MIVELQRFVHWKDGDTVMSWSRSDMEFAPITVNTTYISWVKRQKVGSIEMSEVSFVDHGRTFTIDKTYEEMRELLK